MCAVLLVEVEIEAQVDPIAAMSRQRRPLAVSIQISRRCPLVGCRLQQKVIGCCDICLIVAILQCQVVVVEGIHREISGICTVIALCHLERYSHGTCGMEKSKA